MVTEIFSDKMLGRTITVDEDEALLRVHFPWKLTVQAYAEILIEIFPSVKVINTHKYIPIAT